MNGNDSEPRSDGSVRPRPHRDVDFATGSGIHTVGEDWQIDYRPASFFLLRAPLLPADTLGRLTADGSGADFGQLAELYANPLLQQALYVASPDLSAALDRAVEHGTSPKKLRRLRSRLFRYVVRMSTRPTPFGLFAGVAAGSFADTATVRLNPRASTRTRADMGWLLTVIRRLEDDENLLAQLTLVANPLAQDTGARIVLRDADVHGSANRRETSVRATPVVRLVLATVAAPTPFAEVVDTVVRAVPGAGRARAERLVHQLRSVGVLTSDLRPPLNEPRPERFLARRLADLPVARPVADALWRTAELMTRLDSPTLPHSIEDFRELTRHQRELTPGHTGSTYQTDAVLAVDDCTLPAGIGRAAADAAHCLIRLHRDRGVPAHLADYHAAFRQRYGSGELVPLLDLLSPDIGLDCPPTYRTPSRTYPLPTAAPAVDRPDHTALIALYAEAVAEGAHSVELTDDRLSLLTAPTTGSRPLPPSLDIFLQLGARSPADLARGDWQAVLSPFPVAGGGRTHGRFAHLLGADAEDRLRAYAGQEEALDPELLYADLSYLPLSGRAANVATHPDLRGYQIPVNTNPSVPPERVLRLAEIMVGATAQRLYLFVPRLGRELCATQGHLLNPVAAPNACRFLLEVSQARWSTPGPFDWGPLASAPFLPQVRRGRIVLRPAQWNLGRAQLPGADDRCADADFLAALKVWRERWRVPRWVYLVQQDNRLALDLDQPAAVAELRTELRADSTVTLHELTPGFDDLWFTDLAGQRYFSELVVPLVLRSRDSAESVDRSPDVRSPAPAPVHLPGGEWVSLKLYAGFGQLDDLVVGELRELVRTMLPSLADGWFYLRYADPEPHLRIRLHANDADTAGELLTRSLRWAHGVIDRGSARDVAVVSYRPEVQRYGGPELSPAIHRLFHANSEVCARLLAGLREDLAELDPALVVVSAVDSLYRQWGFEPGERLALFADAELDDEGHTRFRELRTGLIDVVSPAGIGFGRLAGIVESQADAVRAASARSRELARGDRADERELLASLAHMTVNRLAGGAAPAERRYYGWLRQALRAVLASPRR